MLGAVCVVAAGGLWGDVEEVVDALHLEGEREFVFEVGDAAAGIA